MQRRAYLKAVGAGGIVGLAGCSGDGGSGGTDAGTTIGSTGDESFEDALGQLR